jgi:hypothetical protein
VHNTELQVRKTEVADEENERNGLKLVDVHKKHIDQAKVGLQSISNSSSIYLY